MSDAVRWEQVTAVFQEALERDEAARAAYLDIACAGDGALRAEVESLLMAHQAAGRFVEGSPLAALAASAVGEFGDGVTTAASNSGLSAAFNTPLTRGSRLGPYEIVGPLGAGGMGALFRALDTRLKREVAIKVPFGAGASDPDRRQRFQREAHAIAALNHPHICTIHDVGFASGLDYLVLELLQGESLAARLKRSGALPVTEALARAIEIAGALDRAHRAGIVHRDLKPGNVMLTPSGAKVLDFGLARITRGDAGVQISAAGTVTAPLTEAGAVLGTLQYMSPEQLEGRLADARADIFAFGATLYEMVTGRRAFEASSSSGLIAAILRGETPSLLAVHPHLPPALDRIVRTCLEKDPEARFASMHDVAMGLKWVRDDKDIKAPSRTGASSRPRSLMIAVVALTAALLGGAVTWVAQRPDAGPPPALMRVELVPAAADPINVATTTPTLAMSRDGARIAYASGTGSSGGPLIVRDIGDLMPHRVEGAPEVRAPFFSPDGQWIGYYSGGPGLKKVPTSGGTPIEIVPGDINLRGASWTEDGGIVYATTDPETGLLRVSDAGGTPAVLTKPNRDQGEADHVLPFVLPGGRGILFTILDAADSPRVAVLDLQDHSQKVLIPGAASAQYIDGGYLAYVVSGNVFAVRFNLDRLSVQGDPVTLASGVLMGTAAGAYYAVSQAGTLAYVPETATPDPPRTLVWIDRKGNETPLDAPPRAYRSVRLSPDGHRIAVDINDQQRDIWTWDLERQTLVQVTSDPRPDLAPIWTPDSQSLVFQSRRGGGGNLYRQRADGTGAAEPLTEGQRTFLPTSITEAGVLLGFSSIPRSWTLFVLPLGKHLSPEPILQSPASNMAPVASPDGRFVAYHSNESKRLEVYVRPFPNVNDGRSQVSPAGGSHAEWGRNGRELFFLDASGRLNAVPVETTGATFRPGLPVRILSNSYRVSDGPHPYDVSPDGMRFLMIKEDPAARPPNTAIVMVWNGIEALKARAARH